MAAVLLARERGWQVAVRSGGHSWAQWSVRTDALVIDLGALRELAYDDDDRHRDRLTVGAGRRRARAVPGGARSLLPRRALPDRRHRRLPAPGRAGLERPRLGLGGRVRRGGRRGHRGRRARARVGGRERRPLLGRARRGARLLRRRHPLPPAHAAAARPPRADRARLRPRGLRRGDDLAARDPRVGRRHRRDRGADQDRPRARARPGAARHRPRPGGLGRRGGRRAGAVPDLTGPRPRAVRARRRADDDRRAARAPAARQPGGAPLGGRQRLALRPGVGGRAGDAPRLHDPAEREGLHDLVQHGAAAGPAGHGLLAPVGDLPRVVRRVGVARGRRALRLLAGLRDGRPGAGDRRPVPRRLRPLTAPGEVPVGRELPAPAGRSAPSGTPTACSSGTSPGPTARPTATTGSS